MAATAALLSVLSKAATAVLSGCSHRARASSTAVRTVRRKLQRWLWLAAVIGDSGLEFINKQDSLHQNN